MLIDQDLDQLDLPIRDSLFRPPSRRRTPPRRAQTSTRGASTSGVTAVAVAIGGVPGDLPDPDNASLAIGSDGNLYSWGDNSVGELGTGELPTYNSTGHQCIANCNSTTPVKVNFPPGL
jgi:alpha-tubulin suppressor-like RCC1 family protein